MREKQIETLFHRGKRDYPYQSYLRLSLRHGFSRNPEGFAVHVYMGHDLRHDALFRNQEKALYGGKRWFGRLSELR